MLFLLSIVLAVIVFELLLVSGNLAIGAIALVCFALVALKLALGQRKTPPTGRGQTE